MKTVFLSAFMAVSLVKFDTQDNLFFVKFR